MDGWTNQLIKMHGRIKSSFLHTVLPPDVVVVVVVTVVVVVVTVAIYVLIIIIVALFIAILVDDILFQPQQSLT